MITHGFASFSKLDVTIPLYLKDIPQPPSLHLDLKEWEDLSQSMEIFEVDSLDCQNLPSVDPSVC